MADLYGQQMDYTAMVMAASSFDGMEVAPQQQQQPVPYTSYGYGYTAATTTYSQTPAMQSMPAVAVGAVPQKKRYSHNPYAPDMSKSTSVDSSVNSSTDSYISGGSSYNPNAASYAPVYAPEGSYNGGMGSYSDYPVTNNLSEQFTAIIGSICTTMCTSRGRQLLVSVMRLQHLDKIQTIFDEVAPNVNAVVLDSHGGHVVRTLIELLTEEQMAVLANYMTHDTITALATTSQHSRRVLQTMFERHHSVSLDGVVQCIAGQCCRLSKTQQGCIAVMRLLENALPHQRSLVTTALTPSLAELTMDPYGNYVVQSILQSFDANEVCDMIYGTFCNNWLALSCNKFASNVMEKLVKILTPQLRSSLVEELCFNTANLQCLMQDGYGNFVLQAIAESSKDAAEFRHLSVLIHPLLHTSPYGHKIEAKLKTVGRRFPRETTSSA